MPEGVAGVGKEKEGFLRAKAGREVSCGGGKAEGVFTDESLWRGGLPNETWFAPATG